MPRICVAGPSSVVTDAAVAVGEAGGSVVDVAIVAVLTAMCTEPGVCGPGGGGFLTIDVPGHDPVVIDGYMAYPGLGFDGEPFTREVTMPYGGGVTTLVDAGSIAVPGAFAALDLASSRYGTLPWRHLLEAVAEAVEAGFPLSAACHTYLSEGATMIFGEDPVTRTALLEGDSPKPLGSTIVFPGLAPTLRHLAAAGGQDFYEGDLAQVIISDLEARGGQLTREDLARYRAVARPPLGRSMRGWDLALNPDPAIGGVSVARVLDQIEDADSFDDSALARALLVAFEERGAATLRPPSTISIAVADPEGAVVAGSFSAGYVSGVIPKGTGMLMNNALGELELTEGRGAVPGERMISNMAPTVARRDRDAVAIGSPGADRITTAVATTLSHLVGGESLRHAIDAPRAHPEFGDFGSRLAVEPGLELSDVEVALRLFDAPHMYFGGVNGAGFVAGELVAHADSRRTGSVGYTTP